MIGLICSSGAKPYQKALRAFEQIGEPTRLFRDDREVTSDLKRCDWYVMIGNDVIGRPAKEYVYKSRKPFVVITSSFFNVKESIDMVRLHVNGFTNNFASMPPSDPNRWSMLREYHQLGDCFQKNNGDKIVIAMNATTSPAVFDIDIGKWFYDTCAELRKSTDDQLYVRSHRKKKHPHSKWFDKAKRHFNVKEESDRSNTKTTFGDVRCGISLTTTYSVGALSAGIPMITMHPGNFVYDVTHNNVTADALDWYPDRDQLIFHYGIISNCEWSVDEIIDGTAMRVIRPLLEDNIIQNRGWLGNEYTI